MARRSPRCLSGSRWGAPIQGESAQKAFIALFGQILRLQNILVSFDDFVGNEILTERQSQDYRSVYLDLYAEYRRDQNADKEQINDDIVFEIELIKQVEINVDYILMLVQKYREARGDGEDVEIRADISAADRLQPVAAEQEGPHRGLRRLCLGYRRDRRRVASLRRSAPRGRAERDHQGRELQGETRPAPSSTRLPRRCDPDDWHRDHKVLPPCRGSRPAAGTARRSSACSPSSAPSSTAFSGWSDGRRTGVYGWQLSTALIITARLRASWGKLSPVRSLVLGRCGA